MKTFRQFIAEEKNQKTPPRVYRVDPVGREDPWKKSDFAVLRNKSGNIAGTANDPDSRINKSLRKWNC
jgi:hypothetical protein